MLSQRTMFGAARAARAPISRQAFQRRFASEFAGAEDNAFNRERKAVKDHAAATSGGLLSTAGTSCVVRK
jgi:cytochrome c oxidase subunit 6a